MCGGEPCLAEGYSTLAPWKGLVIDVLRRQNELIRTEALQASEPAVARLRKVRARLWTVGQHTRGARLRGMERRHDALVAEKETLERAVLAAQGTAEGDGFPKRFDSPQLQSVLRESEALVDIYKFDQFGRTNT